MKYRLLAELLDQEQAHELLKALFPLMDECAKVSTTPSQVRKQPYGPLQGIEQQRWDLWCLATSLAERAGHTSHRYPAGLCCRPTKKGEPCRQKIRWGKTACYAHMNPAELDQARQWQEEHHLPFPRLTTEDVENFGVTYWDRMAARQRRHVEAQERQTRRINRELARTLRALQKGDTTK